MKCLTCQKEYEGLHFCGGALSWSTTVEVTEALNDKVACSPFPSVTLEKNTTGKGFATVKQTVQLTALTVIHGNDRVPSGSTIWVRGDLYLDAEVKRVFELDGVSLIFVPMSEIKIVKKKISNYYPLSPSPYVAQNGGGIPSLPYGS